MIRRLTGRIAAQHGLAVSRTCMPSCLQATGGPALASESMDLPSSLQHGDERALRELGERLEPHFEEMLRHRWR